VKKSLLLVTLALVLAAATAQAGTMHPALQQKLDMVAADEPVSVIVHMAEQAPIAQLDADLRATQATRKDRHTQVVFALQNAARSQDLLKTELDARMRFEGGILGYTSYWISNMMVVLAVKDEIELIAARSDVDFVELNFEVELIEPIRKGTAGGGGEADRSRGIGITPGVEAINADRVWYELGYTGAGRLIGSLDTGVEGSHPALSARWRGQFHPWQECWLDVLGGGTTFPTDNHGHGTHTTGTMAGVAYDDTIGVAWGAQWIACNAIDQGVSSGFDQDILDALEWFADPDGDPYTVDDVPDVIQNSWRINEGFPGDYTDCDSRWWAAIDNCEASGVVTCWSAGNEGSGSYSIGSPADRATTTTNCFSIGAVDATNYGWPYPIAGFSSRGPSGCSAPPDNLLKPEVVGPGVDVYSSVPGGTYQGGWDGTSMSGPHVAGIVALMRQANPDLDVVTIKQVLMDTALDEGSAGEDNTYGWGFVDAYAAVIAATTGFGTLEGHVYNASHGNDPIPGATVELLGTEVSYTTGGDGSYSGSAAPDNYTARASATGFDTQDAAVEIVADATTVQDFYLNDIAGPAISNVSEPLTTTDTVGPYPISATVEDFSTVSAVKLYYRINGGSWTESDMTDTGSEYEGSLPGRPANNQIDYYVWAQDGAGLSSVYPAGAPGDFLTLYITEVTYLTEAEDPGDPAWQLGVTGDTATTGVWIRDDPVGTEYGGIDIQPEDDHTASPGVKCFVTGNGPVGGAAGENDVDGGCTTLMSPTFDLSDALMGFVKYWRWYGEGGLSEDDEFVVEVSSNGGGSWVNLETVISRENSWQVVTVDLATLIPLTSQVVFRFIACDLNDGGLVEAAIDDFSIETFSEPTSDVPGGETPNLPVFSLGPNFPNPFNPATKISFNLPEALRAKLSIFSVDGRKVATILDEELPAGPHAVTWNGRDQGGKQVASGTYFYRLEAGIFLETRRMLLLK